MDLTSDRFRDNARAALADAALQKTMAGFADGFPAARRAAIERMPEFEALRDAGRDLKDRVLDDLAGHLEAFETRVVEGGGQVHWCRDAAEARAEILDICRAAGARTATKSKSMVTEEIALNDHLAANGITPVETDLGEYIIQLRGEPPSHIIAPAVHLSRAEVTETFRRSHRDFAADRPLDTPQQLLDEARGILRRRFLEADVGITGANILIAETGSVVLVTNEGNADLTMTLPRVHIAVATIEKVVPTLEDATLLLRLLARSATGQELSVYTTFASGPKRPGDPDGPDEFHVVLLDNGRSRLLAGGFREMLRCIKCGACMNHCPVYTAIGGHAYGWVYPGPMGAVLTPGLAGLARSHDLPAASTLCGTCEAVCPVRIPLPALLRRWRESDFVAGGVGLRKRWALRAWAWLARRPTLYRRLTGLAVGLLGRQGRRRGAFRKLPLAGGWTAGRDLPAPQGETFMQAWKRHRGSGR